MTRAEERIGEARRGILAEFESSGDVDTRKWLALYPDVAMDVLDFIVWIEEEEVPGGETWVDEGGVGEAAFRAAFEQVRAAQQEDLHQLSSQLHEIRSLARPPASRRAPLQFQRAAVYAWTVAHLHERRGRVSRLAAQKSVYVLEHALDLHLFEEHQRMRLGPYDSTARYKDAEPIARKKLWVEAEGSALRPGEKVAEADRYAERYLRSGEVAVWLLEVLALLTDDELETFATVQAVVAELRKESVGVGVRSVKERIADIPEWAGKLTRRNFNDRDVEVALQRLSLLGLDQLSR